MYLIVIILLIYIVLFSRTYSTGQQVSEQLTISDIQLLPKASNEQNRKLTFALNKPRSFISHTLDKIRNNQRLAVQLLVPKNRERRCQYQGPVPRFLVKLACAGRLDADSSGLLLFTQDGSLAKKIIGKSSQVPYCNH